MTTALPTLRETLCFNASLTEVNALKQMYSIKQGKATKFLSRKNAATLEETLEAAEKF